MRRQKYLTSYCEISSEDDSVLEEDALDETWKPEEEETVVNRLHLKERKTRKITKTSKVEYFTRQTRHIEYAEENDNKQDNLENTISVLTASSKESEVVKEKEEKNCEIKSFQQKELNLVQTSAVSPEKLHDGKKFDKKIKTNLVEIPLKCAGTVAESFLMQTANDDLDVSGDTGSVGRVYVNNNSHNPLTLDLKGYMLEGRMHPCTTFLVVHVGPTEAKIESEINSYFRLIRETVTVDRETVIGGSLNFEAINSDEEELLENANFKGPERRKSIILNSEDLVKKKKGSKTHSKTRPRKKIYHRKKA